VGPAVAAEIRDFFDSEANRDVLDRLLAHVDPRAAETETGDALAGLTFVFTGSLDGYTRSEAQDLVERAGGSATSSVSSNTDFLVTGSNPGRTKRDDAAEHDVPILDGVGAFEEKLRAYGVEFEV